MKIKRIWFSGDYIYGADESGKEYRQSLLWYPNLYNASEEERNSYKFGHDGIHWRNLDEDVSFESFEYDDAELAQRAIDKMWDEGTFDQKKLDELRSQHLRTPYNE
jgi:hypothetical protein